MRDVEHVAYTCTCACDGTPVATCDMCKGTGMRGGNVSRWTPTTDLLQLRRFGKLGEEIGELVAVKDRCLIQGIDGIDPSSGEMNRLRLEKEIADVYAQLDETVGRLELRAEFIEQRRAAKRDAMQRWEAMFTDEK